MCYWAIIFLDLCKILSFTRFSSVLGLLLLLLFNVWWKHDFLVRVLLLLAVLSSENWLIFLAILDWTGTDCLNVIRSHSIPGNGKTQFCFVFFSFFFIAKLLQFFLISIPGPHRLFRGMINPLIKQVCGHRIHFNSGLSHSARPHTHFWGHSLCLSNSLAKQDFSRSAFALEKQHCLCSVQAERFFPPEIYCIWGSKVLLNLFKVI